MLPLSICRGVILRYRHSPTSLIFCKILWRFLADSFFKFLVSALAVGYIELMTRSYINFDIPPIQSALASPSLSEEGKEIFQYVFGLLAYVFHMALAVYLYLGALGLIEF